MRSHSRDIGVVLIALLVIALIWMLIAGRGGRTRDVTFQAAPGHSETTSYEVRIRRVGDPAIVAAVPVAQPRPDGQRRITLDLAERFNALPPGQYTIAVFASDTKGGAFESDPSAPITVP